MGANKVRPIDGHDGDSHVTYIVSDDFQAANVSTARMERNSNILIEFSDKFLETKFGTGT